MREEGAEALAHLTLEDVRVPVAVRAERGGAVVHVQRAQAIEPGRRAELLDELVDLLRVGDVVARGVQMARVEAQAEAGMPVEPLEQRVQLCERAPDRGSRPGGVL